MTFKKRKNNQIHRKTGVSVIFPLVMIRYIKIPTYLLLVLLLLNCNHRKQLLTLNTNTDRIEILNGQQLLFAYRKSEIFPPTGVDSVFRRSAFIHPLQTPSGGLLTRIQPEDHYHHYGIWNPWTQVLFAGDTVDFWNLYKRQGTVRFVTQDTAYSSGNQAVFQVQEAHVLYPDSLDLAVLHEQKTITTTVIAPDRYQIDLNIELRCATDSPFHLLQYRYGGLGWRATAEWNKENSEVFTSDVTTRNEIDGTTARWCMAQGALGDGSGGMAIFSHPSNYNHPEPLRVWPAEMEGNGDLFINVSPIKTRPWTLLPGEVYKLQYRLLVFDGKLTSEEVNLAWKAYASE